MTIVAGFEENGAGDGWAARPSENVKFQVVK